MNTQLASKIMLAILIIASSASCKMDKHFYDYPKCVRQGWCSGHLETRSSTTVTYCNLPHSKLDYCYSPDGLNDWQRTHLKAAKH